jgi:hypothetical protein
MPVRSVDLKLPEDRVKRAPEACLRAERLAEVSRRVREESMKVNAEFAAIERDPDEAGT